jgi:hypothetical protein
MPRSNRLTSEMRSDLIDWVALGPHHWAGALNEDDFLSRIYNLSRLPSTDSRRSQYPTAAEDIWQHRVNNSDWDENWVFGDSRFNLRHVPDAEFLRFLVETVNPTVRRAPSAASELVSGYNDVLRHGGYEIAEDRRVGDAIYYRFQSISGINSPASVIVAPPDITNTTVLATQLQRLRRDIDSDPAAAIAHCKELLESQCKLVLGALGESYSHRDDLPQLYNAASRALGVHAQAVSGDSRASSAIRGMLRNLQSIVQNVAEARNSMGTGHGSSIESPAQRRHARLVFNATVAVAEFIADTWASFESEGLDVD